MERSETAIEQDSIHAQWMKGSDGSHQLKAATAPKLMAYLVRPTTDALDVDAWCMQFHRTLRDDQDPFHALGALLLLLKNIYETVAPGSNSVSGTVAVHVGVWRVLDRIMELRCDLFPHPAGATGQSVSFSAASRAAGAPRDDGGDEKSNAIGVLGAVSEEQLAAVRRALRDLVAATVRSGLPDSFGSSKKPLELPAVYRYARRASDSGDPIWGAFLSRSPLAHVEPLSEGAHGQAPAAGHGTYRTLLQLILSAFDGSSAPVPSVLRSTLSPAERDMGILGYTARQLGMHLTVLTHVLFCAVPVPEIMDKNYSRGRARSPNFHLLKDFVNRFQYIFISEVVRRADLKQRAAAVALLVRTAEVCLEMNNYDSAVLLVGVLCDASIHRLRKTWDQVRRCSIALFSNTCSSPLT